MAHVIDELFAWAVRTTAHTAVVILLVLAVQAVLGRRLEARWRYALWLLVVVRALAPALPQSDWSVFNFAPDVAPSRADAGGGPPQVLVHVAVTPVAPTPADQPPASRRQITAPALVWLAGCALLASFTLLSAVAFARRLRRAKPHADRRVSQLLDECRQAAGLRDAPMILVVDGIHGPALTGIVCPRIIVPPGMLEQLDDDELRFVLTHELTHLRRRDLVGEWLLVLMRMVHWFNPLVWYAVARCRADRELACDEQVMRSLTPSESVRRSYGRTILKLAQALPGKRALAAGAVGILEGHFQLKRRLRMIARFDRLGRRWPAGMVWVAALGLASCTLTDRKPPTAARSSADAGYEVRVYNVRDLLDASPPEARSAKLSELTQAARSVLAMAPPASSPPAPRPLPNPELRRAAKTADPTSSEGEVHADDRTGSLVVRGTAVGLERVQKLLAEYRAVSGRRQVLLQMQFISAEEATLAALKRDVPAAFAGGDPRPGQTTTVQLDPHAADEFLRRATAAGGAKAIASPQLLLNEGQRGSILVGGEVPYVQGFDTVKDKDGNVAYEPKIQLAAFGLSLDVTATADAPGTQTSLQLESRMSKFAGMKEKPFGKTPAGEPLVVQEPQMVRSEVNAVATVPACHTLLVRGLRGSAKWMQAEAPDRGRADAEAGEQRSIVLLVKSGVITPDAPPAATN